MWSSSKPLFCALGLSAGLFVLLVASGCMSDRPQETDMPWSAPASWEGTMPLPSGFSNRNE